MTGEMEYHRFHDMWVSDRFLMSYDDKREKHYIKDKYVEHKYYRDDWNYHIAIVSLLNDRQGYINYILNKVKEKIDEIENNEEYRSLYMELYDELTKYKEIWE